MQLSTALTLPALVPAIKAHMHSLRFMIVWRPFAGSENLILYASRKSEEDALLEAAEDHPLGELVQRIEYLTPERLAELRSQQAKDPLSSTLEDLGILTKP